MIARTSMAMKIQTQPSEPLERSRIVTPPLTTHGARRGLDDQSAHMKLEPPAKFIGKELPTINDWVEEIEN